MADDTKLPPIPVGVQRLLRLAAVSEPFLAEVERDAEAAAAAAGVALVASERAILRAITAEQLRQIVAVVPEPDVGLASELEAQAREAVEVAAGRRHAGAKRPWPEAPPPGGHRPDDPLNRPLDVPPVLGIRPEVPPERPAVMPVVRGIRPDVVAPPSPDAASSSPRPWLVVAIAVALLIALSIGVAFIARWLGAP